MASAGPQGCWSLARCPALHQQIPAATPWPRPGNFGKRCLPALLPAILILLEQLQAGLGSIMDHPWDVAVWGVLGLSSPVQGVGSGDTR